MPYGIKNESPEQTSWMERCVSSVQEQNPKYPKSRAIAICKAQLKKNDWKVKKSSESELSMREELWDLEKKIREAIQSPIKLDSPSSGPWIEDVFDDFIIVSKDSKLFKMGWSIKGDDVTVDWQGATEVEKVVSYEPVKSESEFKISKRAGSGRVITYGNVTAH
jgi:hypothetical protein